jgi:hypothetical protein
MTFIQRKFSTFGGLQFHHNPWILNAVVTMDLLKWMGSSSYNDRVGQIFISNYEMYCQWHNDNNNGTNAYDILHHIVTENILSLQNVLASILTYDTPTIRSKTNIPVFTLPTVICNGQIHMVEDVKGFGSVVAGLQLLFKQSKYIIIIQI